MSAEPLAETPAQAREPRCAVDALTPPASLDGLPLIEAAFWTAGQRQANRLHEVSYRACFKPQLPRYFIERHSAPGDVVLDPFSGRGTTVIEAGLMGRRVIANDINPLSECLARPRLEPPSLAEITTRLQQIPLAQGRKADIDLAMFYEATTESEIVSLREYLLTRVARGQDDACDRWIRMVATNRLTGHSPGFFSVYSFPPNQAVSAARQLKINAQRGQQPEYRDTRAIILKKSRALLAGVSDQDRQQLATAAPRFLSGEAQNLAGIANASVQLTVTSPPFLDVVQYASDNWLRGWFNGLPVAEIARRITMAKTVGQWSLVMGQVLAELFRVTRPGGWLAFEVGEVRKGQIKLDEHVIPLGRSAGFDCVAVMINSQSFTKTSNIWGVNNNTAGTNSNRILLFRRS